MNRDDVIREFMQKREERRKFAVVVLKNGIEICNVGSVDYHPEYDDYVIFYPVGLYNETDSVIVRCDLIEEIR